MNLAYLDMHDMGGGSWFFMSLGAVIVWGLISWTVVSLIRGRSDQGTPATAREILDRRLATGEISVGEYERLRSALHTSSDPTAVHH